MHGQPRSRLRIDRLVRADLVHLWWAAPPLAVLVLANVLFELTGGGYARIGATLLAADAGAGPESARLAAIAAASLTWGAVTLVYLSIGVATAVAAWRILDARVRGRARRPFLVFAAFATALGFANLALADAFDLPLEAIFRVTLDALRQEPAISDAHAMAAGAIVGLINVLSAVVPALFLAAGAASALPPVAGWSEASLARRALQVRQLTAVAAAFMVAGVLHMGAWTQWASASLGAEAAAVLDVAAMAVTLYWGIAFTLMIASFYVPLAVRLSELARRLMDEAEVPMGERRAWLVDRGLSFEVNRQLPQIAAMAAPLLAGPLSSAIGAGAQAVVVP